MTHLAQSLHAAFPADTDLLHRLKMDDAHFQHLAARYAEADDALATLEAENFPASDERLEELKRQRLHALDAIAAHLDHQRSA